MQVDGQANVKPIFLKTEGGTIQVTILVNTLVGIISVLFLKRQERILSIVSAGCKTDLGVVDQGCKHGRLGASQL